MNEKVAITDALPGFENVIVRDAVSNEKLCDKYEEPVAKKASNETGWTWPNEAAMAAVMTWMQMDMESFMNRQAEIRQLCTK